ncbi:hypothetical protein [Flavivirga spongiicola]|uniref:Transporter n=1 Tax=Flavivirga spongiicola TaxID=421621 RepID=A0ABU7XUX8_9FLAO|nr:hypothetical protein [Flavivirga sp. MEBiC05379]MDO5979382.1 hypothetical protein [Flavivirga sp. MEBiC05379]
MNFRELFFILCVLVITPISAQTCCSGGIPLSNNLGLAQQEKGTIQIGLSYDYNNLNTLNSGTETLNDNSRLRITHSVLLNTNYSITNRLSIEGLFTWVNQRRKISQFGNENLDQTSGIGDAVLLLKYNFPEILGKESNIAIGLGSKIPLGSSTETNDQGITLNADLQPGSNAWDIIYWSSFSKNFNFRPSLTFSSRAIYRSTGTNDSYFGNSSYKFGNEFQGFISFSDQFALFKTLSTPSLSFKYRNARQDKIDGFNLDNTGGNWVSIIPNFSINLTPNIVFSTKAELPIYNNVDGTQLTPTYRITSGFLLKINPKKNVLQLN